MDATTTEAPELVRLRVLWYALRRQGHDAPGAPGIAYDRPVVQSSPQQPAVPHGFGLGHARDVVSERLAAMPAGEVRATLCWYRSHDASGAWASGSAEAILDACVRALATSAQVTAWAASSQEGTPRQRQAHVTAAGRTWARARLARAWTAWMGASC